jgi:phosphoglucosamine mutase
VKFIRQVCPNLDLRGVRLVVDCAHGAASLIAPELLERFGAHVVLLGAEPDGTNINDGAGVFHVGGLGPIVRKTRASLGLALDGDADRVLLVDETGEVRDGDHMLGILAEDLLRRGLLSGHRVVTTIMANLGLLVHLKRLAVTCDLVPVGDRYVAARMAESGAAVGGEQSGHVIFNESPRWFGDGLYTALRVLEIIGRTGRPLSDLAAGVEKFPQVLKNVTVVRKPPLDSLVPLREATRAAEAELEGEGRVVLRYSGTEPLLRVMVEGRSQSRIEVLADHLAAVAARAIGG